MKINWPKLHRFALIFVSWFLIISGVIFGPLPLVPGWALIITGVFLFRKTKHEDWEPPQVFRRFLPRILREKLYPQSEKLFRKK